jgi:hypothetical protein
MQVVERGGRAEGLAFETPGWQNNSSLVRDSSIRAMRWLGSLEQAHPHRRAGHLDCTQWRHHEAPLSYHNLQTEIILEMEFSVSFDRYPRLAASMTSHPKSFGKS